MRKLILTLALLAVLACAVYSATPAKPYPDLEDGDTLSATWLIGTFNTIYSWAQTTHATLASHTAATSGVHGAAPGSAVVTASETQTLTNKTLGSTNHIVGEAIDSGTVADARIASSVCRDTELTAHSVLTGTHGCTSVASESRVATHELDQSTHGCSEVASTSAVSSAVSAHSVAQAVHGCSEVASTSAVTAHSWSQAVHGCSEVASAAALTGHAVAQAAHGCDEVASTTAITTHAGATAVHGCAEVASASAVNAHSEATAAHGCSQIASATAVSDAVSAHDVDQSTHGCTVVASATALSDHIGDSSDPHGQNLAQTNASFTTVDVSGFSSLGESSTRFKVTTFRGTTPSSCGGSKYITLPFSGSSILFAKGNIQYFEVRTGYVQDNDTWSALHTWDVFWSDATMTIRLGTDSSFLTNATYAVTVFYTE